MLDIAWPELILIGAVALVAIGPKDLPRTMHTLGRWVGKARHMAQDMQKAMEQVSREADVAQRRDAAAAAIHEPPVTPAPPAPDAAATPPRPAAETAPHDRA